MDQKLPVRRTLSVDDARTHILAMIGSPAARKSDLIDALGLMLECPILAESDSPRFDVVAMDGYAVQSADIRLASTDRPIRLAVVAVVQAGHAPTAPVAPGTTVRVMTGAVLPEGADAVVPLEKTDDHGDSVDFLMAAPSGSHVRRKGEDIRAGDVLVESGTRLSPAHLGLIAAEGLATVEVFPRPKVAVIATGDELIAPGHALEPGQIWDSNSVAIAGLIRTFSGTVIAVQRVPDDAAAFVATLAAHVDAGAELIVTAGGASRGDRDVLAELCGEDARIQLTDVRMKPGRPLAFGTFRGVPLIGLPGNPVAAFVSALQFVRPAVLKMMGRTDLEPRFVMAIVRTAIDNPGGRRHFERVRLSEGSDGLIAESAGSQGVANLAVMARADGLLVIAEDVTRLEAGAIGTVQVFDYP